MFLCNIPGGYYNSKIRDGVRAIVLNTNLYLASNLKTSGLKDPAHQLSWLKKELNKARTNHEMVNIWGLHIGCFVSSVSARHYWCDNVQYVNVFEIISSPDVLLLTYKHTSKLNDW